MEIKKIRVDSGLVLVDYTTNQGDFRIKTTEEPSSNLLRAIVALKNIFIRRMELATVTERVMVHGFESGRDDEGQWFRINGVYTANLVGHKLRTPKVMHPGDPEEFWVDKDPYEYPAYLDSDEVDLIEMAYEEAKAFVLGHRDQLPLGLEESVEGEGEIYDFGN